MRVVLVARSVLVALPLLAGLALVGAGCAAPVQIDVDEESDFTRFRTWDWIPGTPRVLDAPPPYRTGLDRDMAKVLARALEGRGFRRSAEAPDLYLGSALRLQREVVTVLETGAMETLPSLHSGANFEVQVGSRRTEVYERIRLVVFVVDRRRGATVWKGRLDHRRSASDPPGVADVVSALLRRFPRATPLGKEPAAFAEATGER